MPLKLVVSFSCGSLPRFLDCFLFFNGKTRGKEWLKIKRNWGYAGFSLPVVPFWAPIFEPHPSLATFCLQGDPPRWLQTG